MASTAHKVIDINCPICNEALVEKNLARHLNAAHGPTNRYLSMRTAEEGYRTSIEINALESRAHPRWFQCEICLQHCKQQIGLSIHKKKPCVNQHGGANEIANDVVKSRRTRTNIISTDINVIDVTNQQRTSEASEEKVSRGSKGALQGEEGSDICTANDKKKDNETIAFITAAITTDIVSKEIPDVSDIPQGLAISTDKSPPLFHSVNKSDEEDLDDFFSQISALSIIDSKKDILESKTDGRFSAPILVNERTVMTEKVTQQKKTSFQPVNWSLISTANETQMNWQSFKQATALAEPSHSTIDISKSIMEESKKISFGIKKKKELKVTNVRLEKPVSIPVKESYEKNSVEHIMMAILDTNVLITTEEFAAARHLLNEIPDLRYIVPCAVLRELDGLKKDKFEARDAVRWLLDMVKTTPSRVQLQENEGNLRGVTADDSVLNCALFYFDSNNTCSHDHAFYKSIGSSVNSLPEPQPRNVTAAFTGITELRYNPKEYTHSISPSEKRSIVTPPMNPDHSIKESFKIPVSCCLLLTCDLALQFKAENQHLRAIAPSVLLPYIRRCRALQGAAQAIQQGKSLGR